MVTALRSLGAGVAMVLTLLLIGGCTSTEQSGQDRNTGSEERSQHREALLRELDLLIVPADGGGWALAEPPPSGELAVYVQAAAIAGLEDQESVADAFAEGATALLEATDVDRALGLAASLAVGLGAAPSPAEEALAEETLERAREAIQAGHGEWYGVLMNLTRPGSPVARSAQAELEEIFGAPSCDLLTASPREPQSALSLSLRRLVSAKSECGPIIAELAGSVLDDATWSEPIAATELADIALLLSSTDESFSDLRAHVDLVTQTWLSDQQLPLAFALAALTARHELGLPLDVPDWLRRLAKSQIAYEGGLSDSISGAPSSLDLAAVELMQGAELVPLRMLDETRDAAAMQGTAGEIDSVAIVDRMVLLKELPSCDHAADVARESPRQVSVFEVMGVEVARVRDRHCREPDADLADWLSEQSADSAMHTMWATVYALCLLQPHVLPASLESPGRSTPLDGTSAFTYFDAYLAAPSDSCRSSDTQATGERDGDDG